MSAEISGASVRSTAEAPRTAAVVLAGGRSSRLGGVDKATLEFGAGAAPAAADAAAADALEGTRAAARTTLLAHVLAQLTDRGIAPEDTVVVGPESLAAHVPAGVGVVREDPPFAGPAAGIATGIRTLAAAPRPSDITAPATAGAASESGTHTGAPALVLLLACDMPQLGVAVDVLVEAATAADPTSAEDPDAAPNPVAWTACTPDAERGGTQIQHLLSLARFPVLAERCRADDFVNAPAKALLKGLPVAYVDVPEESGADVDTWQAAESFGLHASHPRWHEAMHLAHAAARPLAPQSVALAEAVGLLCAEDVVAVRPVPHYDSSAMDGFAVSGPPPWVLDARPGDTVEAAGAEAKPVATADGSTPSPTTTPLPAHAAGAPLLPGRARPVLTGGAIPEGASGVVRSEYAEVRETEASGAEVRPNAACPDSEFEPGRHVRKAGRETQPGDVVVPRGVVITPAHVAYAAVNGFDELPVIPRPRVGLLFTGDEVITEGVPAAGQVRDAFGPVLPSIVEHLGGEVVLTLRIPDSRELTEDAFDRFAEAGVDVLFTTGGTGHSAADHVRRVAESRATATVFPEIDVRPGHPTTLGRMPGGPTDASSTESGAGPRSMLHVGLPGNPLAAMVAVRLVGVPVLRALRGLPAETPRTVRLSEDLAPWKADKVVPARRVRDARSQGASAPEEAGRRDDVDVLWEPCGAAGSNMLRGLSEAEGYLVLPKTGAWAGDAVPFLDLPW